LINDKPVPEEQFKNIEKHFIQLSKIENINASPFEILTATAFTCFNKANVRVGIVEVGMGGKLDATNILNNQAVSVIAKIARDHEAFLGNTLEEIAKHKAGILRPNVPYIVNPENEKHVQAVIDDYAKEIGAGPRLFCDTPALRKGLYSNKDWQAFARPLRPFQRDNAAMAIIAAKEAARNVGGEMLDDMIADELGKVRFRSIPGRLQQVTVPPVFGTINDVHKTIIVDGAHNRDAAIALSEFVTNRGRRRFIADKQQRSEGWPVTWVLAMTDGKDAQGYLRAILKPGDKVITTSFGPVDGMPWVKPMDPKALFQVAQSVRPDITGFAMPKDGTIRALCAAKHLTEDDFPIVLTGSLYLVGDFYREMDGKTGKSYWLRPYIFNDERPKIRAINREERIRVRQFYRGQSIDVVEQTSDEVSDEETDAERHKRVNTELEAVDQQIDLLRIEQEQASGKKPTLSTSIDDIHWDDEPSTQNKIRRISWPSTENPPPSDRPFPGKFKELRERPKKFRASSSDEEMDENRGPRIHMHFSDEKTQDRRMMRRPSFLLEKKWEA
jgi:folylpolyglutamate synthase/dihydrofolate synthase